MFKKLWDSIIQNIPKPESWIETIGDDDQIRLYSRDNGGTSFVSFFSDGRALKGQITAAEWEDGEPYNKIRYKAGSLGAHIILRQIDIFLMAKGMNDERAIFTQPHLCGKQPAVNTDPAVKL